MRVEHEQRLDVDDGLCKDKALVLYCTVNHLPTATDPHISFFLPVLRNPQESHRL